MSGARPEESAADDDALIGRAIAGKFAIVRRLGAGAMGAVYRAEQTALERTVAIKVMQGRLAADKTYAARFALEAKAASRLDHPNLIRVLDYGQEPDGLLYIAMEYLECRDLFSVLAEDWPLSHERIVDLLSQTLSGLAEAHEAGVLHRDLKPENIMVVLRKGDEGRPVELVKVGDFGIAKLVEPMGAEPATPRGESRKLTTAGLVVGTPEYMSPEQARGESFDARSDVYAVGVILYQMLTRRLPFQGKNSIEVVFKAMNEEPAKLGSDGLTAAPGLDPICMKAMSKRPEDRYQTAREMRAALRAATSAAAFGGTSRESRERIEHAPTQAELASPARSSVGRGAAVFAVAAVGAVILAVLAMRSGETPSAVSPVPSVAVARDAPDTLATAAATATSAPPAPASDSASVEPTSDASAVAPRAQPATSRMIRSGHARAVASVDPPADVPTEPPAAPVAAVAAASVATIAAPPPPQPAAVPTTASPPPAPSSPLFNATTARVEIGQARCNNAAAASSSVTRALAPLAARFTGCFRSALAQPNGVASAGAAREASADLHLESDDEGYVTVAQLSGAPLPAAARCIEALSHDVHIQVDTGTANADVTLTFEPQ